LDGPVSAVIGVPDKGERCGSIGACAPMDSANRPCLWLGRALQGRRRGGLMPARRSNAVWRGERGVGGCIAMSPKRRTSSKAKNAVSMRRCKG